MALGDLIDHFQSPPQSEWLCNLHREMGSLPPHHQGPSVYFIVSHDNLDRILSTGRLLPRVAVEAEQRTGDLSASFVQARRRQVYLGDGNRTFPPKEVHECLNFFWNPLNLTLDAMCRNALILNDGSMPVAILQFPLERIRDHIGRTHHLWACSKRNIAAGGFATSLRDVFSANDWPWEEILAVERKTISDDARSAEFLLWIDTGHNRTESDGLPIGAASRVFVPDVQEFTLRFPAFPADVVAWKPPKTRRQYLQAEEQLEGFFRKYSKVSGELLDRFEATLGSLGLTLGVCSFRSAEVAMDSRHGIPHVTRVMFWAFFLAYICQRELLPDAPKSLEREALIAAWLHDLCRRDNQEHDTHGREAVEHYQDDILLLLGGVADQVRRVREAVEYHCRPDDITLTRLNPIYMILKDADALDRGRFSGPCHGEDCKGTQCDYQGCTHSGCAYKTLRLSYDTVSQRFTKDMAWAAYWLARATRTAHWPENDAVAFFLRILRSGLILAGRGIDGVARMPKEEEDDYPF